MNTLAEDRFLGTLGFGLVKKGNETRPRDRMIGTPDATLFRRSNPGVDVYMDGQLQRATQQKRQDPGRAFLSAQLSWP